MDQDARERPTPPGRLITSNEEAIVKSSARVFIKGVVPRLPELAKYGGPALAALLLAAAQHWSGKADTDAKVEHADHVADVSYETLAASVNAQAKEIAALKTAAAQLADTVQVQGRLLLASRPGFTPTGQPTPFTVHRARAPMATGADPMLVRKVSDNATKGLAAIKAQVTRDAVPTPKQVPAKLEEVTNAPPPAPVVSTPTPSVVPLHVDARALRD